MNTLDKSTTVTKVEQGAPDDSVKLMTLVRTMAFPISVNVWPVLLFVSQKLFVAPSLLLVWTGDRGYRRDAVIAFCASFVAVLTYLVQHPNPYADDHLIGFLLFIWSVPLVNYAVRVDVEKLRVALSYLTIANAVLGFFFLITDIDLTGFRGLNRIVDNQGVVGRVYFESASLAAVVSTRIFRNFYLRALSLIFVVAYVIFVARSVVVMMILFANLALPYFLRSSVFVKIATVVALASIAAAIMIYLPILRPDVQLSLDSKQFQLDLILGSISDSSTGWGWGSFFPQLATDPLQPYQIEMQLPMLLLQIGVFPFFIINSLILLLFLSETDRFTMGVARFAVYILIGFNNPWLFLPSWYLTCQLLFRYKHEPA